MTLLRLPPLLPPVLAFVVSAAAAAVMWRIWR